MFPAAQDAHAFAGTVRDFPALAKPGAAGESGRPSGFPAPSRNFGGSAIHRGPEHIGAGRVRPGQSGRPAQGGAGRGPAGGGALPRGGALVADE